MELTRSLVASCVLIVDGSMRMQPPSVISTRAPSPSRIILRLSTSAMFGRFSRTHGSPARIAAGMIATAAFFAPLIVTVPSSRLPP